MTRELTIYRQEARVRAWWAFVLTTAQLGAAFRSIGRAGAQAADAMRRFAELASSSLKTARARQSR